jgi:two-component system alkaline phosphatase synthesis response regulator PhoP
MVVEDDELLAEGLKEALEGEGYDIILAADGETALSKFDPGTVDLIILDIMLPGIDGFAVCEKLRQEGHKVAILFLSAKDAYDDRIRGIEAGGDDYLPKPFNLEELLARIRAIFRRIEWAGAPFAEASTTVSIGKAKVDFRSFSATRESERVGLSSKECAILKLLYVNRGEVVPREKVIHAVWGAKAAPTTRTVDNFIVRLRKLIEPDVDHPRHIQTVRGIGYRLSL